MIHIKGSHISKGVSFFLCPFCENDNSCESFLMIWTHEQIFYIIESKNFFILFYDFSCFWHGDSEKYISFPILSYSCLKKPHRTERLFFVLKGTEMCLDI